MHSFEIDCKRKVVFQKWPLSSRMLGRRCGIKKWKTTSRLLQKSTQNAYFQKGQVAPRIYNSLRDSAMTVDTPSRLSFPAAHRSNIFRGGFSYPVSPCLHASHPMHQKCITVPSMGHSNHFDCGVRPVTPKCTSVERPRPTPLQCDFSWHR
jgi:hypothetical protein